VEQPKDKCAIIQDLLPIYADNELSKAATSLVEEHLKECQSCQTELQMYQKQLFDNEEHQLKDIPKASAPLIWLPKKGLAIAMALIIFIGAGGLSWAYKAGKNTALSDPEYRRAFKEDLFTPVHQTKKVGPYEITIQRMLIDAAQTVVFYEIEPELKEEDMLNLKLADQDGRVYEPASGFSYGGKEHVFELAPVSPKAKELTLSFSLEGTPAQSEFKIDIDPTEVQVSTSEWWPGIKREAGPVKLSLEHVILGFTKSQVNVRAFWPLDDDIRGLGFGIYPPVGPKTNEEGKVTSASSTFYNIPSGTTTMGSRYAALLDTENRRKLGIEQLKLSTDSVSGGLNASFNFQPVAETTSEVRFTLPNLYLYRYISKKEQQITLDIKDGHQQELDKVLIGNGKEITLTGIERDRSKLTLSFQLQDSASSPMLNHLPEFVVANPRGIDKSGIRLAIDKKSGKGTVILIANDGPTTIKLNSIGELLDIDRQFDLSVPNASY